MKPSVKALGAFLLVLALIPGACDMTTVGKPPALTPEQAKVPSLTIIGLPANTRKTHFSGVNVYNALGVIAACADYQGISIVKENGTATAVVPLKYSGNTGEYFTESGEFVVTFAISVDVNIYILKVREEALVVGFEDGFGTLDLSTDRGYFSGSLLNPLDLEVPVVKAGTVFEINNLREKVTSDMPVQTEGFTSSRVIYVYAVKIPGSLSFMAGDTAPVWNDEKNGFYSHDRRALWKMVYLKDTTGKYAAKTYIMEDFKNFDRYTVDDVTLAVGPEYRVHFLNGASNLPPQNYVIPEAGWYVLALKAGGGGGGGNGNNQYMVENQYGGAGGAGGAAAELVYIDAAFPLILFTGSGGSGGVNDTAGFGYYAPSTGGGGGGSGVFAYNAAARYLLAAGGGGGGAGAGSLSTSDPAGGGGGAGGSLGSGGGAGSGASIFNYEGVLLSGTPGGAGGGAGGGTAGMNGAAYGPPPTSWGFNGDVSNGGVGSFYAKPGGKAAYTAYDFPDEWMNTTANGQGGYGSLSKTGGSGGAGGNNRNALRGGGAPGGGGGGASGGAGSITVYRVP